MEFTSTHHPISWFRDMYREGRLVIKPPYQRKPVWTIKQKCYLIETILLQLPIPEIFVQQTTTAEGMTTYAIVDGQQRIRSVLQFVGSETEASEEEHNKFVLDKLPSSSPWRNVGFADLSDEKKRSLYGYMFSVRYLRTHLDEDVRDMFRRLNRFLSPLRPQELRNATYSGPLVRMVEKLADDEYWSENRIVTPASIRRQGDIEFVSELVIGTLHGPQGGSPKVIDDYYEQYEDYDDEFPNQRTARRLFDQTLSSIKRILPNIKDTRWSNKTDFYTLFVGVASLLRSSKLADGSVTKLQNKLSAFGSEVDMRLSDEHAPASKRAIDYVRAVEKGANDKGRRAIRHLTLLEVMGGFFRPDKAK